MGKKMLGMDSHCLWFGRINILKRLQQKWSIDSMLFLAKFTPKIYFIEPEKEISSQESTKSSQIAKLTFNRKNDIINESE